MPVSARYRPDPAILSLGDAFYDVVEPAAFPERKLRFRNDRAAREVGLDTLSAEEWEAHFARFAPLPRNLEHPLALRYHGHQFGVYNPALGDGRGFLFAQVRDARGRLLDLGTKGSGTTPWSRGGDGRLTLKGGVREVLATEMLEALGVKTSRTLSLFETGEKLHRGDEPSPTRSSVLVRLGHSHVRFGTFQRLAHGRDVDGLAKLVDYSLRTYFPELSATLEGKSRDDRVVAFLDRVVALSATLAAQWMTAGFCHGVLNTDNMTITGDSFDYGPYRFVPTFDPDFVAAYFDHGALYAFGKQPEVVTWNLGRLADALRVLAPSAPLGAPIASFADRYDEALTLSNARAPGRRSTRRRHRRRARDGHLELPRVERRRLRADVLRPVRRPRARRARALGPRRRPLRRNALDHAPRSALALRATLTEVRRGPVFPVRFPVHAAHRRDRVDLGARRLEGRLGAFRGEDRRDSRDGLGHSPEPVRLCRRHARQVAEPSGGLAT